MILVMGKKVVNLLIAPPLVMGHAMVNGAVWVLMTLKLATIVATMRRVVRMQITVSFIPIAAVDFWRVETFTMS